jgi:Putative Flp pilus-assembly TadE/G-like
MLKRLAGRLRADKRGSIAIVFAGCLFVIGGCVGCALDYGRWHSAKSQMQLLLDSATLDAGQTLLSTGLPEKAIERGQRYFNRDLAQKWFIEKKQPTFEVGSNGTAITGRFENALATPFLSMIGVSRLKVELETRADVAGASKAALSSVERGSGGSTSRAPGSTGSTAKQTGERLCGAARQFDTSWGTGATTEQCDEPGDTRTNSDEGAD